MMKGRPNNMDRNKWRNPKIAVLVLIVFFLQGCSLASEGKSINDTQDELIGAWVVLKDDSMDYDYEIDLKDFKKEDSTVIYLDISEENDAQSIDYKTSGNIYPGSTSYSIGDQQREIKTTAKIYFSSSSPELVKLYNIYEKPNGERYATGDSIWSMIGYADDVGSLGSMFISNSYTKKEDGKEVDETVSINVEFERAKDLISVRLIHLDENYDVVLEDELDLKAIGRQDETILYEINSEAEMVVVEETFTTPKDKDQSIVKSIYIPRQDEEITHDFIIPVENDLAKKETIEFIFKK